MPKKRQQKAIATSYIGENKMNDLTQSLELLALGMGGIFIVMFLLFIISQAILKITAPKKNTERDKV